MKNNVKTTINFILCLALLSCMFVGVFSCKAKVKHIETSLVFPAQDSGFFTKKECFDFLVSNDLADSVTDWTSYAGSDTIGRYYRINGSENYLAYVQGVIAEVSPSGKLVKGERICGSGAYCYGLENEHDKFRKIGDCFCITLGQTGSGYYACNYYLFKGFPPQNLQTIPGSYWYNAPGYSYHNLESEMELRGDTLIMHYTFEQGDVDDSNEAAGTQYNPRNARKFNVTYIFKDNNWTTTEKHKFDGLEIEW